MKVGVVTDSITAAIEASKGGAAIVIICQSLLQAGAGLTPSLGAVITLASLTSLRIYVLLRPVVGTFTLDDVNKQVLLSDVRQFAALPNVAGLVFAAQAAGTREVDVHFTKQVVANAGGKEVWYHRAYMCLASEFVGFKQMKECGVSGVLISLHGEVSDDKIQYAYERLDALERIGMRGMLSGSIDKLYRQQVMKGLSKFIDSKTLHSWVLTVPVESSFEGALLPWREWDIGSYLWPDVKTERLRLNSVSDLVSSYVALETNDTSPNSTVAPTY